MSIKLMPCPFCGGDAYVKVNPDRLKGDSFTAMCKRTMCLGRNYKKWPSARAAAIAWNTRENAAAPDAATQTQRSRDHFRDLAKMITGMKDMDVCFGEAIRMLRKSKGMTQQELADAAGVACETIINYENGRRKDPPMSIFVKIVDALDIGTGKDVGEDDGGVRDE